MPDRITLKALRADIDRARALAPQIAALEGELKAIKAKVKKTMEDAGATEGFIGTQTVATISTTTRTNLDTKALKDEQPEMAQKYTRTIPVQSFRITDAPEAKK